MVRIHPDPPVFENLKRDRGAIAQLGERLLCKQEVIGSIPIGSTSGSRIQAGEGSAPGAGQGRRNESAANKNVDSARNQQSARLHGVLIGASLRE